MRPPASTPKGFGARLTSPPARHAALNLLVVAGYWLLAALVFVPGGPGARVTPVWPAVGLAVAAVYLGGFRLLPAVAIGALLATLPRTPLAAGLVISAGVAIEALVATMVLRRLEFSSKLDRVRDSLVLAFAAAPAGALVSAAAGTLGKLAVGHLAVADAAGAFVLWAARDWLGILLGASLIFAWVCARPPAWTRRLVAEGIVILAAAVLIAWSIVGLWPVFGGGNVPIAFAFFPLLIVAGLRFGVRGATTLSAFITAFTLPVAALGLGPFAELSVPFTQFLLFLFVMLGSLSGLLLAAIIAERDEAVARRLALEEQLRHSQKMEAVGRLAGGIAHDFNNLLTAIIGYTEIVLMGLDRTDPRRADAEEIGRAAMRAADLTRQMLAFSRRQVLQPKVIDLNTALSKVEPMLRRVIGEDIVMTIAPRASRPLVRVDPGQIEQVIMNLAVNARDAMPQGGRLTVETGDAVLDEQATRTNPDARPGAYVMLAVSDTGTGMSHEVKARIFEPYFTTKDVGKGTGLGLSTAYGIVRQSDGLIDVYSEPGLGTTLRIYLPRAEAEAAAVVDEGAERIPQGTEHVLLVEDEASVRRLSKEILVRLGYTVTEAASGRAGLALGSDDTRHFDLVLCDVILGDMSGPAVVEALRALRPSIRVLYMSGYTDDAIVRTGVLDEGRPFLQKPFTPVQLAHKVREVIDAKED